MIGKTLYITERIHLPAQAVYDFLAQPENFPKWASGLGRSFKHIADHDWQVDTPMGPMTVRFSPNNEYGIVDHWVIPAEGAAMYTPMRVIDLGQACDVVFTLLQRPGMTDTEFDRDAEWVRKDLRALNEMLESCNSVIASEAWRSRKKTGLPRPLKWPRNDVVSNRCRSEKSIQQPL